MLDFYKNDSAGKLVVRLVVGILILFHGVAKLLHTEILDSIGGALSAHGLPGFIAYGVLVGEVVAPLLLITGVYARVGGLLIVINMLFAVGMMHMGSLFAISEHGGYQLELQAFFLFGGLAVLLLGSGRFALRPD